MRRMIIVTLATTMTAVAVPAASHYLARPSDDPLGDTLRANGFVPIRPPSNLMNVGSLYYVDASVTDFKAICHAEKADLEGAMTVSRSWEMQESLERNGRFATGISVDFGTLLNGDIDDTYVQKVHSSLTDVARSQLADFCQADGKARMQQGGHAAHLRWRLRVPGAENPAGDGRVQA
jgi:hypothetical protein